MKNEKRYCFVLGSGRMLMGIFFAFMGTAGPCAAQGQPLLQITSPAPGALVNPGQTLSITVTSPAGASFAYVQVGAGDPIGFSSQATSLPAQVTLTVPAHVSCGQYGLIPFGTRSSGFASSQGIQIDVERPDMPTALSTRVPATLVLDGLGQHIRESLLATFADGSVLDVTNSTYVTYSSSNTSVATVDSTGTVTAGVAGTATITATYTQAGQSVQLAIPVTVEPSVMLVTPPSLSFGNQEIGTASAPQQVTVTNQLPGPMKLLSVSATGDFSETGSCSTSAPPFILQPGTSCTVNVTFTPSMIGPETGALSIDNNTNGMSTVALSGTGLPHPTITTVTSSANPSVFGHSITLTATVTPDPGTGITTTGSVTFADGSTSLHTVALFNGVAAYSTSSLSVGSHSITATYTGDTTYQGSVGSLTQVVN